MALSKMPNIDEPLPLMQLYNAPACSIADLMLRNDGYWAYTLGSKSFFNRLHHCDTGKLNIVASASGAGAGVTRA